MLSYKVNAPFVEINRILDSRLVGILNTEILLALQRRTSDLITQTRRLQIRFYRF